MNIDKDYTHIAMFDEEQCQQCIKISSTFINKQINIFYDLLLTSKCNNSFN